jgi:hypothetical protein
VRELRGESRGFPPFNLLRPRVGELNEPSSLPFSIGKPHPQWAGRARGVDDERRRQHSLRGTRSGESRSRSDSGSDRGELRLEAVKTEPGASAADASSLYTLTSPFEPTLRQHAMGGYYERDDPAFSPTSPAVTTYSGSPYTEVSAPSYFSRQSAASSAASHSSTPYPVSAHTSPSLSIHMPMQGSAAAGGMDSTNMLSGLAQHLQTTVAVLRQLPEHATTEASLQLLQRATDLQTALR